MVTFNDGFSDLNKEKHFAGPTWIHKFEDSGISTELGAHFGITRPSESTAIKWGIRYSF